MMQILVNGDHREFPAGSTIANLVATLDLRGRRMAVEVNEEVVPRGEHTTFVLKDGDKVEVVNAVGGG